MLHVLCLPIYIISLLGLLPDTSSLRGAFFERALDASLPIFLFALTVRSEYGQGRNKMGTLILFFFVISYIALTAVASIINFGVYYFFVEYRQYMLIFFSIILMRSLKRKFSLEKILKFSKTYILMILIVFFINSIFKVQYRPGVFGESNYDIAVLAVIFITFLRASKVKRALSVLLAFTTLSLSRTAMATFFIFMTTRIKEFSHLLLFVAVSLIIFSLLGLRSETSLLEMDLNSLDRVVMAKAYFDEAYLNSSFMIFGQPLANDRSQLDALSYYSNSQPVSAMLGVATPSNFHGHLLRGFSLLGVVGYLPFLGLLSARVRRNFTIIESNFVSILVIVTGFTQSLFSHPLVGTLLFVFLWIGFSTGRGRLS